MLKINVDKKHDIETKLPVLKLIVLSLAILSVLTSFNPQWGIWGLDSSIALPAAMRIVLALSILVAIVPLVSDFLDRSLEAALDSLSESNFRLAYLIFSAALIGLFVLFTSRNQLQGDGYNVMGHLIGGYIFSPTEPLDYLLHFAVAKPLGGDEAAVLRSYQLCSYVAGALFLAAVYIMFHKGRDVFVAISLAAAFGVFLFFFGYVESYAFRFLLMFLYSVSATRDWPERKISWQTTAFLMAAIGFHLSSLVLIPSFALLVWNKYRTRRAALIVVGAITGLVALAVANLFFFAPVRLLQVAVPLAPTANNPYHLFSTDHILDIMNALLLSSPLIIMLGFLLYRGRGKGAMWAAALAGPALLFMLVVDPKIGAFRDWDLLSIAAAPVMVLLIFAIIRLRRGVCGLAVPVLLFAVLHTGGWVLWNTNADTSYARIRKIVREDKHYSKEYYQGYNNKAWSIIVGKFIGDKDEVVRATLERYRGAPDDTLNVCNMAHAYLAAGDTAEAASIARDNWRRFAGDAGAISALGSLMHSVGQSGEAETMYESFIMQGGDDYRLYRDLGMIKEMSGRTDTAMILYDRSLVLWGDAPIANELAFYLRAASMKYYSIANVGLQRISPRVPELLRLSVIALIESLASNDFEKADSLAAILNASGGVRKGE